MIFRRYEIVEAYADGSYATGGPRFWTYWGAERIWMHAERGRLLYAPLKDAEGKDMHYEIHYRKNWEEVE